MTIDNPFESLDIADMYEQHAGLYHNHDEAMKTFMQIVPRDKKVLEIGVGTGLFTKRLLEQGYNVQGVDRSRLMLNRAEDAAWKVTEQCDFLDYNQPKKYDVIVSHSGGFTFKRERFETYYQTNECLELVFLKLFECLEDNGLFLVNKGEHENEINLCNDAKLTIEHEDIGDLRDYTYEFVHGEIRFPVVQRRLAIPPHRLQDYSSHCLDWKFDQEGWIVGKKK